MSVLTQAIYDVLSADTTLTDMLATYNGEPAIFTTMPAPGDAALPYIVTAGDVAQEPADTKTTRGRMVTRDVKCFTDAYGSAVLVEAIAERVRTLLHRQIITVSGYTVIIAGCSGPMEADEQDCYCRIVTVRMRIEAIPAGYDTFDYTAGGLIPEGACIQAFDPYVVKNLTQSYVDLTDYGNDAVVVTPPIMGNDGWLFNGVNQYVSTGLLSSVAVSVAIQFSSLTIPINPIYSNLFGYIGTNSTLDVSVSDTGLPTNVYWAYGDTGGTGRGRVLDSGNVIFAGGVGYINGVWILTDTSIISAPGDAVYIAATNFGGIAAFRFANVVVERWAVYNIALDETQVAALAAAMNTP